MKFKNGRVSILLSARASKEYFREGQLLVESLVALSLLTVGFLGMFSLLSRSLSLNRIAADNYIATYLAAEGIEVTRNIVDANALRPGTQWISGLNPGNYEVEYDSTSLESNQNRPLMFDPINSTYSYSGTSHTNFTRLITISWVGSPVAYEIKVSSKVSWTTLGGGSFQINLEDHFMNWRL